MSLLNILGPDGLLSQVISGFIPRESQQKMAEAILRTLELQAELIVEAGTGTGKTFGYLIPVFLTQKKTIISTGTKNLQDQLFLKDIPTIKKIFPFPRKVVLLKGRANYLCLYRLDQSEKDGRLTSKRMVSDLHRVVKWGKKTKTGDIAEMHDVSEDSGIWPMVTSTVDNCLNQDCPLLKKCFVVKARQQAMAADIVVVNHHLFFADRVLQEEGFGELLPHADAVIFDEAHHLPEMASQFFSTVLSSRQLIELSKDSALEASENAKDMSAIPEIASRLQESVYAMRLALGKELHRAPWPTPLPHGLNQTIQSVNSFLKQLEAQLKEASLRSKGLENCWRRSGELIERFHLLTTNATENAIHWYETHTHSFVLQHTPMVVADYFKQFIQEKKCAWIFTSATLTVKESFQLFSDALGLSDVPKLKLASPFDYQKQAILYAPRGLPDPNASHYTARLVDAIIPILEMTQGKAFVLFTSYKAMGEAALLLKDRIAFPLLLQGEKPKRELIDAFRSMGNAVLLGTSSFWYGVDVRGEALSCVIIDKLPFAAPHDPILKARIQLLRKQGIDPFSAYQLPNAVLTLKQGVGRLIRDHTDRGILVICDPRLVGARYGEIFLQSLPPMTRTRELTKVREFFIHDQVTGN